MNILFYYPDNERSISLSTLMIEFRKQGHNVFLLTHADKGLLHQDVEPGGVKTFCYKIKKNNSLIFYLKHIRFLISFLKKNKIDIVYSHIQVANFISVFASRFSKARFILCRHHSDCAYLDNNFTEKLFDKVINRLGKEFIVPSQKVKDQMTLIEKAGNCKIYLIRYAYDFDKYPKPRQQEVDEIRLKYKASLLVVKVARLIPEKRHLILFDIVRKLRDEGLDIKVMVLSDGPERANLESYISIHNLKNNIFMLGYKTDVMNYLAAADIVVHVSESEASNSLIKEAGILKKAIVVCSDVGDFDEYLVNGKNALVLAKTNPGVELEEVLRKAYRSEVDKDLLGTNLCNTVIGRFSLPVIIKEYDKINAGN